MSIENGKQATTQLKGILFTPPQTPPSSDSAAPKKKAASKSVTFADKKKESLTETKFFIKDSAVSPLLGAMNDVVRRMHYDIENDPLAKKINIQAWKIEHESKALDISLSDFEQKLSSENPFNAFAHDNVGEIVLKKLKADICPPNYPLDQVIKCIANSLMLEYMVHSGIFDKINGIEEEDYHDIMQSLSSTEARELFAEGKTHPSEIISIAKSHYQAVNLIHLISKYESAYKELQESVATGKISLEDFLTKYKILDRICSKVPKEIEKDPLVQELRQYDDPRLFITEDIIREKSDEMDLTLEELLGTNLDKSNPFTDFEHHNIGSLILEKLGTKSCPPYYPLDQVIKCKGSQLLAEFMVRENKINMHSDSSEAMLFALTSTKARQHLSKGTYKLNDILDKKMEPKTIDLLFDKSVFFNATEFNINVEIFKAAETNNTKFMQYLVSEEVLNDIGAGMEPLVFALKPHLRQEYIERVLGKDAVEDVSADL